MLWGRAKDVGAAPWATLSRWWAFQGAAGGCLRSSCAPAAACCAGEGKGDLRFQPLHLRRTWRARASCLSLPAQLCHGPCFDDCFSGCRCTGDAASVSSPAWRYLMGRRKLETSSAARFCSGCEVFSKVSQTPLRKVLMRRQWAGAALNQCFTTKQIWAGIVFLYAVSSSWKLF